MNTDRIEIPKHLYDDLKARGANVEMEATYYLSVVPQVPIQLTLVPEAAKPVADPFFKPRTVVHRTRFATDVITMASNWQFKANDLLDPMDLPLVQEIASYLQKHPDTLSRDLRARMVTPDPRSKTAVALNSKAHEDSVSRRVGELIRAGILISVSYREKGENHDTGSRPGPEQSQNSIDGVR